MKTIPVLILLFLTLWGCKSSPKTVSINGKSIPVIDFNKTISAPSMNVIKLSEIIDTFEYILLEIPKDSTYVHMTSTFLFTQNYIYNQFYQFDRKSGKFIQTMGHKGRGPGEFPVYMATFLFADSRTDDFIVSPHSMYQWLIYNANNEWIHTQDYPEKDISGNHLYLGNKKMFTGRGIQMINHVQQEWCITDLNTGKIIAQSIHQEFTEKRKNTREKLYMLTDVKGWLYEGNLRYYNPITRGIYSLDTITWQSQLEYQVKGNKYMPSEDRIFNTPKVSLTEYLSYLYISKGFECTDYLFLTGTWHHESYYTAIHKKTGECFGGKANTFFKNDLGTINVRFPIYDSFLNGWYDTLSLKDIEALLSKDRETLTEAGKKEYDLCQGLNPETDFYQIIRLMKLK